MKPLSSLLFYIFYFLVIVLGLGFLILDPGREQEQQWHTVAVVRASTTPYLSRDPETVGSMVAHPLEKAIGNISNHLQVETFIAEKEAIFLVSVPRPDGEDGFYQVKDAVEAAKRNLPQDMDPVEVIRPVNEKSFLLYTVESPVLSNTELFHYHEEEIVPQLERFSEVQYVQTLGGQKKVMRICPDVKRMDAAGLTSQDVQNALLFENTHSGLLHVKQALSPDEMGHTLVKAGNGSTFRLNELCVLESYKESLPAFSGRRGVGGKITGLIYLNDRFPAAECKQKIRGVLDALQLPSKSGVKTDLFDPGQDDIVQLYPSPKKALLAGGSCLVVTFILLYLVQLRRGTKILLVLGIVLLFGGIFFVLRSLSSAGATDVLHITIALPPNDQDLLQREKAAADLGMKLQKVKGIDDMIWYGGWGHNYNPFDACQVHYYLRPAKNTDHDLLLKELYEQVNHVPGLELTHFPQNSDGLPVWQNIMIKAEEKRSLDLAVTEVTGFLGKDREIDHIYAPVRMIKPVLQYGLDNETASRYGIPMSELQALKDLRFNIGNTEVVIGCGPNGSNAREITFRDMNNGGVLRRLPLTVSQNAVPVAVHRLNGKYCSRIRFMTPDPQALESTWSRLGLLSLPAGASLHREGNE